MPTPLTIAGSELIRGLQERAARALPAEHVHISRGWWLRHAPHCAWWVGTVLPHGDAEPDELLSLVEEAERFYTGRGALARFQISQPICPKGIDELLADRGYRRESPILLQAAETARVLDRLPTGRARVVLTDHPTREWFNGWLSVRGYDGDPRGEWELLERIRLPSGYVAVMAGDEIIAVGRAVADAGWAGVFGMGTLPKTRGKGAAGAVLSALAEWAATQRADHLYLQVECGNPPALRLYERAGFTQVCDFHYRTGESPSPKA